MNIGEFKTVTHVPFRGELKYSRRFMLQKLGSIQAVWATGLTQMFFLVLLCASPTMPYVVIHFTSRFFVSFLVFLFTYLSKENFAFNYLISLLIVH